MSETLIPVSQWTPLGGVEVSERNIFLFKFLIEHEVYTLLVTDLTALWKESITKDELFRRAKESECPIDPSQDYEQLEVFFKHLMKALSGSPDIKVDRGSQSAPESLIVSVTCSLPTGLQPLRWVFNVKHESNESLRREVVFPLIQRIHVQQQLIDELVGLLRAKDSAVTNLIDKVESSGIAQATIFPTATSGRPGRRINQRDHIRRTVKGLQSFDAAAFLGEHYSRLSSPFSVNSALRESLGENDVLHGYTYTSKHNNHEGKPAVALSKKQDVQDIRKEPGQTVHARSPQQILSDIDDSPAAKSAQNRAKVADDDDTLDAETTEESEEDTGAASRNAKSGNSADRHKHDAAEIPATHPILKAESVRQNTWTSPMKPTGRRLGMIGGLKQRVVESETTLPSADETDAAQAEVSAADIEPRLRPRPKLGAIGGRKVVEGSIGKASSLPIADPKPAAVGSARMRSPQPEQTGASVETSEAVNRDHDSVETEEQRADRKREALKRELDTKSKSEKKKKRKF